MATKKEVKAKFDHFRQGDILFKVLDKAPDTKKMKVKTDPIVAYGEVTGHAHRISSPAISDFEQMVTDEKGDIYCLSPKDVTITHDEHGPITIPGGSWCCITRQREYDPLAADRERKVAD